MKQTVIVKGNIFKGTQGITVIFDKEIPFEQLCQDTAQKFKSLSGFLGQHDMAVAFEGREFTAQEEQALLNIISDNSQINILFLVENDPEREVMLGNRLKEAIIDAARALMPEGSFTENAPGKNLQQYDNSFYCGTLRSGQIVNSKGNVVIVGDVNPGGTVISDGSIIILGSLRGVARAGATGDRNAFVVALEMHPTQIFISEAFGKGASAKKEAAHTRFGRKKEVKGEAVPLIALYEDGGIVLKQLNKETLSSLENALK